MQLPFYNPHRKEGFTYNIPFRRDLFTLLQQRLQQPFIQVLVGLRRIGKTTLMRQLMDDLITQGVERSHIVCWSFDSDVGFEQLMNQFQSFSSINFETTTTYVFLDEIQKLANRQTELKIYYDRYPRIHFFVSGSASLFVSKVESLAGRMEQHYLYPLSRSEYMRYKDLEYLLKKPEFYTSEIITAFEHFVHRQFFDTLSMPITEVKEYVAQLSQKILFEDMIGYFDIRYPDLLKRLRRIYSQQPGMLLDYNNIAKDLQADPRTVQSYTHYMTQSLLCTKLEQFSTNASTKEKKIKKIYPSTPSFCQSLEVDGALFELFCIQTLGAKSFWRHQQYEVDCITEHNDHITAYECKYRREKKSGDTKGLQKFVSYYPHAQPILLTQSSLANQLTNQPTLLKTEHPH